MSPEDRLQRWWKDPRYRREAHIECSDLMAYLMDVVVATAKEDETLKATQTRWVPCSERMPTVVNKEDEPYLCLVTAGGFTWRVLADWAWDGELGRERFHIIGRQLMLKTGWKIVAWLENLPEFVPEAKP